MKFIYMLPMAAAWMFACGFAQAHGPQIQLTGEMGQIVTRRMFANEPYHPLQAETRIYVIPVGEVGGNLFVKPPTAGTSGPGIAVGLGYDDDPNTHPFQSGEYTLKFTDGLLKWNGASFEDAGSAQLRANKTVATATTTDSGPFETLTWEIIVDSSDAHSGLTYRFLGDGLSPTSELADGIYLASLQLAHGTLIDSEPFYYVLPHNSALSEAQSAAEYWAGLHAIPAGAIQVVPEPAALVLVAVSAAVFPWRRKS